MERPLELIALAALVALIAIPLLGAHPGSRRRQAVVGGAIGAASALVVATQQADLVPDGLEAPLAALALVGLVCFALVLRHRAASR